MIARIYAAGVLAADDASRGIQSFLATGRSANGLRQLARFKHSMLRKIGLLLKKSAPMNCLQPSAGVR
jgi:hypothetical protein